MNNQINIIGKNTTAGEAFAIKQRQALEKTLKIYKVMDILDNERIQESRQDTALWLASARF